MNKSILLIITGGIAAYKSLLLIRLLKEAGYGVKTILTKSGSEFVTPLSISALTGEKTYTDLFSLTDETEMGHIELSRSADLVVVAPATADMMAKMANGLCNDLATTTLLATNKPILIAPAMNVKMWEHPATQRNLKQLEQDGATIIHPTEGKMACGEFGFGRMAEPEVIFASIESALAPKILAGKHVIITSGGTREPIDPVRYITNHSSGKQGHALAEAAAKAGAKVTLISGIVALKDPVGVKVIKVETALQMHQAVLNALPADIYIGAAAVADWRVDNAASQKLKKQEGKPLPTLTFIENPDILKTVANSAKRPKLVIGFAAETENVIENAKTKLSKKNCDMIIANDVSTGTTTFGGETNLVHIVSNNNTETLPRMSKADVATKIIEIAAKKL